MKKTLAYWIACLTLSILLSGCAPAPAPDSLRAFDDPDSFSTRPCLVILNPTAARLKTLIELETRGLFKRGDLRVVGVYHEKESAQYQRSIQFARERKLDWIGFHRLTAALDPDTLFQDNGLTDEFRNIFEHSDGALFFGGADIPPALYGRDTHLLTAIHTPYRHFLELSFAFHLLGGNQNPNFTAFLDSDPDYAILGLCLGMQNLNVATGGTLVQDIWTQTYGRDTVEDVIALGPGAWHNNPFRRLHPLDDYFGITMHPIKLDPEGIFVKKWGFKPEDAPYILSSHHQAADTLGRGFKVAATSPDGRVIEAVEHTSYSRVLGFQFHPEASRLWDPALKSRFTPQDETETSLRAILEENPPSWDFHVKIWSWFRESLEQHKKSSGF